MQSAGTRLDPVTAAAGSAHAGGRKERSAGGAAAGVADKRLSRISGPGYSLQPGTDGRGCCRGGAGSGEVRTRRRCCIERPLHRLLQSGAAEHPAWLLLPSLQTWSDGACLWKHRMGPQEPQTCAYGGRECGFEQPAEAQMQRNKGNLRTCSKNTGIPYKLEVKKKKLEVKTSKNPLKNCSHVAVFIFHKPALSPKQRAIHQQTSKRLKKRKRNHCLHKWCRTLKCALVLGLRNLLQPPEDKERVLSWFI